MRIVIDLQGAQSESRFRGVGRYSLALALAVARNADGHEIWLLLNGALADAIPDLRHAFADLVPPERICVFEPATPAAALAPANGARARASELLREYVLAQLRPDLVLVTSLFEGYVDDSATSVGLLADGARTVVVLYDLIPLLNPAAYLPTTAQQDYYRRKIESLRRAGLLLSISDYSRQEALDALQLAPQRVVSISTAIDPQFRPAALTPAQLAALRQRFGLTRAMLMYAPGGFDARKNIDGLITAFSLLPPDLRAARQLLIASKLGEQDRHVLLAHARRRGLGQDELILTGYVSDATLIELFSIAELFVFPSRHEGFGLPALEAMACGAPVIGADNTSIPEVIGCTEALFDAGSPPAIAAKIAEVLGDPAMLERLRVHGRTQAASFSWDATARRALRAMEAHGRTLAAAPAAAATPRKPRLAFVSPLPPERTGIADYAAQLLPALTEHFEIELVLCQEQLALPPQLAALPRRSVEWFARHGAGYDHILYQFGNSPFHSHMFDLLRQHPGVVVLHDFFLSSVLVYEQMSGLLPDAWRAALAAHGYGALQAGLVGGAEAAEAAKQTYPGNLAVLRDASHVIVHSEHARDLARQWYGAGAADNWSVVPLPRAAPPVQDGAARAAARAALGIRPGAYLVCSFGFIAPTKLTHELVQAWRDSPLHADPDCELVLVGANHGSAYGLELTAMLAGDANPGRRIRIAGWTDEADYQRYLQAADAAVQLRSVSRGETSAAVLDCMNHGLPTIVNANGSMAALPDDCVLKLPDAFAPGALSAALHALHGDIALRRAIGARARQLLRTEHSPAHCAALYAQALARAAAAARHGRPALLRALADVDGLADDPALQRQLACAIAAAPDPLAPRQLLVDVTTIARHDLRTGIERVVRSELLELLKLQVPGLRVEPVYLCQHEGRWQCRYARRYTYALLGLDPDSTDDPVADVRGGDLYYGADFAPGAVGGAAADGLYARWRNHGVNINFVLYDLLPVLHPEFFPPGADAGHAAWLATIAAEADRLVCISNAVADDMLAWLERHPPPGRRCAPLRLAALHLGADLASAPTGAHGRSHPLLPTLRARPTFLMVGTIEPRKGHLQALAAVELLWQAGVEVQLVIVGNEGWKPLPAAARRTIPHIVQRLQSHPELGRRLHWLQGLDDAALEQLYGACACLLQPSEGEGFGLPLIEAASRGLPLLARDLPVFREVAQDRAYYFSGLDGQALADAMRAWLDLHAVGAHPLPDGMRWSTWRDNAAALLAVLAGQQTERLWPAPAAQPA